MARINLEHGTYKQQKNYFCTSKHNKTKMIVSANGTKKSETTLSTDFLLLTSVSSKVDNCGLGRPEGSLFNSYYTKV